MIRYYSQQHRFYAGVDLHARSMFTHVLDHSGNTIYKHDLPTRYLRLAAAVTRPRQTWIGPLAGDRYEQKRPCWTIAPPMRPASRADV